jgi:hypothetical protein
VECLFASSLFHARTCSWTAWRRGATRKWLIYDLSPFGPSTHFPAAFATPDAGNKLPRAANYPRQPLPRESFMKYLTDFLLAGFQLLTFAFIT